MEVRIHKFSNPGTRRYEKTTKYRTKKGKYKGRKKREKWISIEEGK
jgi:hypothetical protein